MEICPACSLEISSKNANTHLPLLGLGKLGDGTRICSKCYLKLNEINSQVANDTKKYTIQKIKEILDNHTSKTSSIESQLLNIGINSSNTLWGRKEIKELPNILSTNEVIKGVVTGVYNGGSGILVATNIRLVFIDKGLIYGLKTEDFGYDKVTSVQYESGILTATIKIMASGNIAKIDSVDKSNGKSFAELVRTILAEPSKNSTVTESQPNILDQLEKLAKLKEIGVLSESEFDEQKKKLLDKL